MSDKQFFNNLSATYADVRRLDAKKINLKGKNILEYIKEATPTITYTKDTRETVYTDDLWGQWVETKDDGTIVIHDDYLSNPNTSSAWLSNVKAVQDNKAYSEITTDGNGKFTGVVEDSVLANIQTERIENGKNMFKNTSLTSFSGDLSSLVTGTYMFSNTKLTSFNCDLSSLDSGSSMFFYSSLTSFNGDLGNLHGGASMFDSTKLTSFSGDLSSLVYGYNMFYNTKLLTSFSGDLSSLVNGLCMFDNCAALTTFNSDLSSLVYGASMFQKTSLTPQSVMYIVESIRNITEEKAKYTSGEIPWVTYDAITKTSSEPFGFTEDGKYVYTYGRLNPYTTTIPSSSVGKLTLGINVTNNSSTIEQQLQTFAEECVCNSWEELKQEFIDKGWTVTFQYGGTETSITYGLREGEQIIPCPIFAKLVQVEDKDTAKYCTEDASSFYNIEWGHDVTDTTYYTQFNSLEDAMTSWNVFPKENIITTEE